MDDHGFKAITPEEWVVHLAEPRLSAKVPEEIHALFEVARGCMAYGPLFYPLLAVGLGHAYRADDAALGARVKTIGGDPEAVRHFRNRVEWLISRGALREEDRERWGDLVDLRNFDAHLERPTILPPGMTIGMLGAVARQINEAFESPAVSRA